MWWRRNSLTGRVRFERCRISKCSGFLLVELCRLGASGTGVKQNFIDITQLSLL